VYEFTHFDDGRITNVLEEVGSVVLEGERLANPEMSPECGEPPTAKAVM
jgi:hypothetical protein